MSVISFKPTAGLSYNPNDTIYWEKSALHSEIVRTFELCHSCRMCFKFCDVFPDIFDLIDNHNVSVENFSEAHIDKIAAACFQCKLCYIKCPYTKDDQHEFDIDFPRLLMRHQAIKAKEKGISLVDKILANPDRLGAIGSKTAVLANWANKNPLNRALMQATVGIQKDKKLPQFASVPFQKWFAKNGAQFAVSEAEMIDQVVLFHTCFGNYNNPDLAKDAVFVLWKNRVKIAVPKMNCCGMPALENGDMGLALKEAEQNFQALMPLIRANYKVLVLNPTCSLTMKNDYPVLLEKKYSAQDLELFSKAIYDINEYLFKLKQDGKLNRDFKSSPGKVAYHIPCHLRAQNIGYRSRDVMKSIANTSFKLVDECCGHNGTWSMKKENFADSMRIGKRAFDLIREEPHDVIASDCPLAAVQIEQGTGETALHPIQILARAYRTDGFSQKIVPEQG